MIFQKTSALLCCAFFLPTIAFAETPIPNTEKFLFDEEIKIETTPENNFKAVKKWTHDNHEESLEIMSNMDVFSLTYSGTADITDAKFLFVNNDFCAIKQKNKTKDNTYHITCNSPLISSSGIAHIKISN